MINKYKKGDGIITKINVLSLFDGMSCGQLALEKLKIEVSKYFASEIKPSAVDLTQSRYPNTIQLGNIVELDRYKIQSLPKVDLLMGGSPCQNLSIAMATEHRSGLSGDKSGLFYEYYRVLQEVKPTYFLLENVGSMRKDDRDVITELLGVKPIKINSRLVSAQLRNRYYWTNITDIVLPEDRGVKLNDILVDGWSDRDKARCLLESESRPLTTHLKMFHRYYSTGFTTLIFKSKQHYEKCVEHYNENFKGLSAKEIDAKLIECEIDTSIYDGVRYLYQSELESLQTVPNGYTATLDRNTSAGLLGDGWTVDVIAHILSFMEF